MKALPLLLFLCLAISLSAQTQTKTKAPPGRTAPAPPPGLTIGDPAYPVPQEERGEYRDLQLQWDELELDNQHKLLEIERNHAKQKALEEQLKVKVVKFAQKAHVNLDLYDFDPKDLKLARKK